MRLVMPSLRMSAVTIRFAVRSDTALRCAMLPVTITVATNTHNHSSGR